MANLQNSEYICIRLAKLQKWYNSTKENCSVKYFDYIRLFYYDLYHCAIAVSYGYFAEGKDKLLHCRKTDVADVFKKYRDNLPKFKNWDIWAKGDFDIAYYYMPCEDYQVEQIKAILER